MLEIIKGVPHARNILPMPGFTVLAAGSFLERLLKIGSTKLKCKGR